MQLSIVAGCAAADSTDGVSTEAADTVESVSAETSDTVESTAADSAYVMPMPTGIDMDNLDDCTVAASFDEGDIYQDDSGMLQMKLTVYAYDIYDIVDISMLKVGDVLQICGSDCAVTALETNEYGIVIINGGTESGGYELCAGKDTNGYYAVSWDDAKLYNELGTVTIPVSDEMTFEDSSDLDAGTVTFYAGDFLTDYADIIYHFVPNNTTVRIEDGKVVQITRVYMP